MTRPLKLLCSASPFGFVLRKPTSVDGPRLQILNLLQWHDRASVDQLSKAVGLASATVRRHLDILQRDHLIAFDQVKKKTGRPEYTYYLTDVGQESMPKDYGRLVGRLLQELSSLSPADVADHCGAELLKLLFQRMAFQTAARNQIAVDAPFPQRLAKAVAVLQQERFEPEVQEADGLVRILLHNCPFRSAALENGSVCTYDSLVLSTILGTGVSQEKCIHKNDSSCCYVVPRQSA
ncbi:MAG: winged helix-turn-helix transcriptional regulator [Dehalococcoidia bacterium]|nr:winged helix-turn-helix transcriptional regulator [Dehalococcoidia bacterium]